MSSAPTGPPGTPGGSSRSAPEGLRIVPIPEDPEVWRQAARWCLEEWQDAWPDDTEETYLAHYRHTAQHPDSLPVVLAALQGEHLLGVITLVEDDELPGASESPWLAACVVAPQARGRGVGRALVAACESLARDHGYRRLHLFTWSEVDWYASLGWQVLREVGFAGHHTTVMAKDL